MPPAQPPPTSRGLILPSEGPSTIMTENEEAALIYLKSFTYTVKPNQAPEIFSSFMNRSMRHPGAIHGIDWLLVHRYRCSQSGDSNLAV